MGSRLGQPRVFGRLPYVSVGVRYHTWKVSVMARSRVRGSLIPGVAVFAAVMLAGCTSPPADANNSDSSALSTTPSAVSTTPLSSVPSSTSPPLSSAPVVPSSGAISAEPSASTNPWSSDLTSGQIAQAQAAIGAYKAYWSLIDQAGMQPGNDWTEKVAEYASGPEKANILTTLAETAARGQRTVGETVISPVVTDVQPAQIAISDCIDKSHTDLLNSAGVSIKAPDAPGSYIRHPAAVQMAQLQDGRWQVVLISDDWSKTC